MGLKRFVRKGFLFGGGALVEGHIHDALEKKVKSGRPFRECLEESVKESFTEDTPGLSHMYQLGKKDGRVQGTVEQAQRDEVKIQQLNDQHDQDRKQWAEIDKAKDNLIDELCKE